MPGLDTLAAEMAGAKPARFPTLWEVLANGIIFQQISLESASSIMNRFVRRYAALDDTNSELGARTLTKIDFDELEVALDL